MSVRGPNLQNFVSHSQPKHMQKVRRNNSLGKKRTLYFAKNNLGVTYARNLGNLGKTQKNLGRHYEVL